MTNLLQRCLRDRSAGIALMFAVTAIPTVALIGIAIDFGFATQAKAQLDAASDAAALAAAKGAADAFSAGRSDYIAAGQSAGVEWFNTQAKAAFGPEAPTPSVAVTQNGAVFSSSVTYQSSVKPYFAPLYGVSKTGLGGLSSATITATTYIAVTFLLDNSSSMLVAATQDGVNKLISLIPVTTNFARLKGPKKSNDVPNGLGNNQCAFACHWDANGADYYGLARANNIQLRFDVLQSAAVSAIQQMIKQKNPNVSDQFAITVYTFDNGLTQLYPTDKKQSTSTDLASGVTAVQNFETPVVIDDGNTNFPKVMKDLVKNSTTAGNGSSPTNRKQALIIVTDGLADYNPRTIPSSEGPINPADCAAMKSLGYSVYVLYTTFITTPLDAVLLNNHGLLPYLTGFDDKGNVVNVGEKAMVPSLQSCASAPANFAQASDPAAINTAMTQLLQAAIGNSGRYTQ